MVQLGPGAWSGKFVDRAAAGRALAERLVEYADRHDVLVLGLPRGGVPVAHEVAQRLDAQMDVLVVRKLGTPGHPELAMGAIASGGMRVLNKHVLVQADVTERQLEAEIARQQEELERRERLYRGDSAFPEIADQHVIVVDDGLATGATMRAAVGTLRAGEPREIVIAVPVAAPHVQEGGVLREADRFIALLQPDPFYAVGLWYRNFEQTTDSEVATLLQSRGHFTGASPP